MGTSIVISSGKGGTGKTTAVAAISSCLAALGHRTLCIDGDVGLKNLDLALALGDQAGMSFLDVIEGRAALEDAVIPHPSIPNLDFLTAPQGSEPEQIPAKAFRDLLKQAKALYDFVFVDAPAGIGAGFRLSAIGADKAVLVANGDPSSLRDAQKTLLALNKQGVRNVCLLANRISGKRLRRAAATVDDMIDGVGARLIGVVPEDPKVPEALACGFPLVLYSAKGASKAFLKTARRLAGHDVSRVFL